MKDQSTYLKVILAFVIFSSFGPVFNKSSFTAIQNVFFMCFLATIWLMGLFVFKKKIDELKNFPRTVPFLVFFLSSGFIPIFWLQSLTLIPVAQALFLLSSVPIIALLIEILVFKQKTKRTDVFAILIGITGIVTLLSGGLQNGKEFLSIGSIFVLVGAILIVIQGFAIKKLEGKISREMVILVTTLAPTLFSPILALRQPIIANPSSIAGVIYLSIFPAIISLYFYAVGLEKLKLSTVRLIGYIEVFLGTLWGVILLGQPLTFVTIIGGALILFASFIVIKSGE